MNSRRLPAFPEAIRSGVPRAPALRASMHPMLAGLAIAVLVALAASACSSEAAPAAGPPPPEVSVASVLTRDVSQWEDFTGRVAAVESVELRPRVSGYVQRVAYAEGEEVRKGDLLFVVDPRPYQAALDRALAELARAQAESRLAGAQDARAQSLIEVKAISREEFEQRKANTAGANAAVRAAEAAVTAARLDLQFTQVRSPIDGRAGRALVTQGSLAQADATLLTTVVSQDPVFVYFEADEQTWLRHSAAARSGDNPVRVGLSSETGYPHTGTLDFIDNQVDPRTGTLRVLHRPPDPRGGAVAAGVPGRRCGDLPTCRSANTRTWCRPRCRCARSTRAPTRRRSPRPWRADRGGDQRRRGHDLHEVHRRFRRHDALTVTFRSGTDIDLAAVQVQNRVAQALPRLPESVRRSA
jgi:RND family efflux transporter MFP subunit